MIQNNRILFKYKSVLKIISFNKKALNKTIWYVRSIMFYLFYFLLQQTNILKNVLYYKFISFLYVSKNIIFKDIWIHVLDKYLNFLVFHIKKLYFLLDIKVMHTCSRHLMNSIIYTCCINDTITRSINNYNTFYYLYKKTYFIIYVWLYSIKIYFFCSINSSNIPNKKHSYVVLRSPHKDKKAREKFKMFKYQKNVLIPSFLYSNYLFNTLLNESFLLKSRINIKKS